MITYPVYIVKVIWTEDGKRDGGPAKWWPSDPGDGRIWNSIGSTYRMYRDDPGSEAVQQEHQTKWWPKYAEERAEKHPSEPTITAVRGHDEEWCPGWFSHWTFDVGQSDVEALASFAAYIDRIELYNRKHGETRNGLWMDAVCLMGAEDRWRWCAKPPGDSDDESGEPPCRCEHCLKLGILRIDH